MRIGVDIDNTTLEFQPYWASLYETWFDRKVDLAELDLWNAIVSGTHFGTAQEFFSWFDRAGGWVDMPWVPGAPGAIDALIDAGHTITFITARGGESPNVASITRQWHKTSPWGAYPRSSDLRLNIHNKASVPANVYIDDAPHHLEMLQAAGKRTITFDCPWNQDVPGPRACSWGEVLSLLEEES